jgi:hypothetical protein
MCSKDPESEYPDSPVTPSTHLRRRRIKAELQRTASLWALALSQSGEKDKGQSMEQPLSLSRCYRAKLSVSAREPLFRSPKCQFGEKGGLSR